MSVLPPAKDLTGCIPMLQGRFAHSPESIGEQAALEQMRSELAAWDALGSSLQTFRNPDYLQEVTAIAPLWLWQQATHESIERFKAITTFDPGAKTLVIKIMDDADEVISYKRRRYGSGKWVTVKGTHPNKQTITYDRGGPEPLWIIEGHHDALTALLLDMGAGRSFNFIMVPTASYPAFTSCELDRIKGRDLFFLPDMGDQDDGGIKCMVRLVEQAEDAARSCKLVNLMDFLERNNKVLDGTKADLSDAVAHFCDLESFVGLLHYHADRGVGYEGEEAF